MENILKINKQVYPSIWDLRVLWQPPEFLLILTPPFFLVSKLEHLFFHCTFVRSCNKNENCELSAHFSVNHRKALTMKSQSYALIGWKKRRTVKSHSHTTECPNLLVFRAKFMCICLRYRFKWVNGFFFNSQVCFWFWCYHGTNEATGYKFRIEWQQSARFTRMHSSISLEQEIQCNDTHNLIYSRLWNKRSPWNIWQKY